MFPVQSGAMNLAQSRNMPAQSSTILGSTQVSTTQTLDITSLMNMMIQMMMLVMVMKMMSGAMKGMNV